ncbi:hypothetical protein I203_101668 [Kwoniella mangroviensis CBS 8507]|uniref:uncharacterized protein n=1 Tax=Kwoniella mangroviensis CBS 8507 TaxID=1296122 RepID=UPI00080D7570|nr:uncharacterized protein I203_07234 [Kwoniella mangroviensis CBS 8507]OCF63538.1 hypothetical protein I203_07234 [Kwoniella mangroviensis CBS 8507]
MNPKDSALDVSQKLKEGIAKPTETLRNPDVSYADASEALGAIRNSIAKANAQFPAAGVKHDLSQLTKQVGLPLENKNDDDLNKVGGVLADVIRDIVEAVMNIKEELKKMPLIGSLILEIDTGLNTLLVGLQLVLAGVVEVLRGLLSGVSGSLKNLGNGLTFGEPDLDTSAVCQSTDDYA